MFKILSKDPAQTVGSMLLPTGVYTKEQETYEHLLGYHFPNCEAKNIANNQNYSTLLLVYKVQQMSH